MIRLVASTVPTETSGSLTVPQRQWREYTASNPRPGLLAFLVFEVACEYELSDYFVGLHDVPTERGYLIAGTVDDFRAAIKQYRTNEYPYDVNKLYGYVIQKLRDFGYDAD